jgi:hypothetical protein
VELGPGELPDQSLGECALLVADLRLGAPVDLANVVDLIREVEPLEEEAVLVDPERDRRGLAAPGESTDGDPSGLLERLDEDSVATLAVLPGAEVVE